MSFIKITMFAAGMFLSINASALTIVLDFDSTSADIFGQTTGAFDHTTFGFAGFASQSAVESEILNSVTAHFNDYPDVGLDPISPIPVGRELDINFESGTFATAPANGDSEYHFVKVGAGIAGANSTNLGILGAACGGCARTSAGVVDEFGLGFGNIIGAIWTDHIDNLISLAGNDLQLINLIAGTISHEIGHTLSLAHAGAQGTNPGDSAWGVMGSGATSMPNTQRVLEREFTFANFGQLIGAVGLRDVVAVPAPAMISIFAIALLLLNLTSRRRSRVCA